MRLKILLKLTSVITAISCIAPLTTQAHSTNTAIDRQIAQSEYRLELREQRLAEHRADLEMLDKRIERRVAKIVELLATSRDSKDSNVTISTQKKQVMEALAEAIERYKVKRNELLTVLARSEDSDERKDLEQGLEVLDNRISQRVDDLITLNQSFARSTGYESFHKDNQLKRTARIGEGVRRQVNDALRESIQELEKENASYRKHLAGNDLTEENRELIRHLLEKNEALIDHREDQLIASMTEQTPTKRVGKAEANTIRKAIEEVGEDLNESLERVFWLADRIAEERRAIHSIKLRIDELNAMKGEPAE